MTSNQQGARRPRDRRPRSARPHLLLSPRCFQPVLDMRRSRGNAGTRVAPPLLGRHAAVFDRLQIAHLAKDIEKPDSCLGAVDPSRLGQTTWLDKPTKFLVTGWLIVIHLESAALEAPTLRSEDRR